jgi:manganese/zinc/iron transport system substrate-binding protein
MKPVFRTIQMAMALLIALGYLTSMSLAKPAAAQSDPIRIVTTIGMLADAIRNIGGDRVEVSALMGPGIDPHLYKPTAGDVRELADADVIVFGGHELEGRMTDTLETIARTKPVFAALEALPTESLLAPEAFGGRFDPHVWFDVTLWSLVVDAVTGYLSDYSPDDAEFFRANADTYLVQLTELDSWVREQVATVPENQRVLVTAHDAFGYFGHQYGFEVQGLQGISTATEASANDIQDLVDLIVDRQIPAIFVESSVPPATIEAVQAAAQSRGWDVTIGQPLFSDAMGEDGTFEGTYIGMVTWNVNAIVSALTGAIPATPAA